MAAGYYVILLCVLVEAAAFNNHWGAWYAQTGCSVTCGDGTYKQIRNCVTFFGFSTSTANCHGPSSLHVPCHTNVQCPAPTWGQWGSWMTCSVTCGSGIHYRLRTCTGGNGACPDSNNMIQTCDTNVQCPVSGGTWSVWGTWQPCSSAGEQISFRQCNPQPGSLCVGSVAGTRACQAPTTAAQSHWQQWGQWSTCSATCGSQGHMTRRRTCVVMNGQSCTGSDEEKQACASVQCQTTPPPSQWGSWELWGACSVTCGQGQASRSRHCLPMNANCNGNTGETRQCDSGICPALVNWEGWNQWNQCSASCGGGTTERTRHCPLSGSTCAPGGLDKTMAWCNAGPCFGSFWSDWSAWDQCSVTCEVGQHSRSRSCKGDGSPCSGRSHQTADCDTMTSCATWTTWSAWELCSVTCGLGTKARLRVCQGGNTCTGKTSENTQCDTGTTCPIVGTWSAWSYYGACSTTCGVGTMERTRQCQGGTSCPGNVKETAGCNTGVCPTASSGSQWEQWAPWLSCSVTCGTGIQFRFRTCSGGSSNCPGDSHDIQSCNTNFQCSITSSTVTVPGGTWSDWGTWHPCTIVSLQSRFRHCPMGPKCGGRGTDIRACQAPTMAPVNWESWNQWTTCSASCGGGTAERTRHCPSSGNTCAPGGLDKTMGWCNAGPCFVGTWSAWSYYGACSTTCGVGTMERTRQCQGGTGCPGNVKETAGCNTGVCPTVSVWGAWSVWSTCSVTCGTGFHIHTRTCSSGNTCQGSSHGQGLCGTQSCVVATTQHTAVTTWSTWTTSLCSVTCGFGHQSKFRVCSTGINTDCTGSASANSICLPTNCP